MDRYTATCKEPELKSIDITPATRPAGSIEIAISGLNERVEELISSIGRLTGRLSPVLSSRQENGNSTDKPPESFSCPLEAELKTLNRGMSACARMVYEIDNRLQL